MIGTIPAKLILQLTTAFKEGGLCNRDCTFFYRDHLNKTNVPVLAIAGDLDLICPPEAVEETVKLIPEHLVTYKVFGKPGGPHYAHYDLVGGRLVLEWSLSTPIKRPSPDLASVLPRQPELMRMSPH
ncbi:hypothetical protein L484_017325 [Morus notabilis]|uniref:Uncharacterized protein n=1 Tax=Morus notabilis TaxID=981085 RepID=W9RRM8_9ROSA|nr:hypothetical protein L484_017325 [Morus notabilis]